MISLLTLLPILGGLLVLIFGRKREMARLIAALFGFTGLLLSLLFWYAFDPNLPGMQFTQWRVWAPSLGIEYHVGVDGLGVLMLVLSALLVVMSLAASWANEKLGRVYFALVLFLEAGLFGTFTALNFVHWFLYWELSLIPAFFLVRVWGGRQRARAANQFFLYTMVGSVALLLAFLAIYLATGTFDFVELTRLAHSGRLTLELANNLPWFRGGTVAPLLFWAAFLGFAVKTPLVPFHTWLPATYAEAPSETTMLLT
ncbi:MAG: proton-conducting transporter membrane subunit, partial [Acidobacteriaceae bacterium]